MTAQVWVCPKCNSEYVSPLRVVAVTCHQGHSPAAMKTEDEPNKQKARAK